MNRTSEEILEGAVAEAERQNASRGKDEVKHFDFEVFNRYRALCEGRKQPPLPIQKENAVAYLLVRTAEGVSDADLSAEMRALANFHLMVPERCYGNIIQMVFRDFYRALQYAEQIVSDSVTIFEKPAAARRKAASLFSHGAVPARFEDVAA